MSNAECIVNTIIDDLWDYCIDEDLEEDIIAVVTKNVDKTLHSLEVEANAKLLVETVLDVLNNWCIDNDLPEEKITEAQEEVQAIL